MKAIILTTLLLTTIILSPIRATTAAPLTQDLEQEYSLTPQAVQTTAKNITVRITTADNNGGSGVLIASKRNSKGAITYLVLTNKHVVGRENQFQIQTPDGKKYTAQLLPSSVTKINPKYDVALLQFISSQPYQLAKLQFEDGQNISPIDIPSAEKDRRVIYMAGYPFDSDKIRFSSGKVSQLSDVPFDDGTQIGYVPDRGEKGVRQGMSGGPIIDPQGIVIGINTIGSQPILPNYTYFDGSKPTPNRAQEYTQANWGVPIYNFLTQLDANILYGYDNLPKVERQLTPTGYMATLNNKARQVTVRIETAKSGNGSGVIVAREGNSYYVLTAKHVVQNEDNKKLKSLRLITYDQDNHNPTSTVVAEGVDLAIIKFSSNNNYSIAQLGEYSPSQNAVVFAGGFPGRDKINSPLWQWQLNPGGIFEQEQAKLQTQNNRSFSNGYDLMYSNITYAGMSGGPVFDTDAKVIGIHGRSEQTDLNSLGISIQTFTGLTAKLQVKPNLLKIDNNNPATLTKGDLNTVIAANNIPQPQEQDSGERWLVYGNQLYRARQIDKSILAFDRAISKGQILSGNYGKALSLWQAGKLDLAEIAINRAIATLPNNNRASYYYLWKVKSAIMTSFAKYNEAIIAIDISIRLEPNDMSLQNEKALTLGKYKKYELAFALYDEIIRNRSDAYTYYNRGVLKIELENERSIKDTILDCSQAIKLNPSFAVAYLLRGTAKFKLKYNEDALADFNQAIKINPNNDLAYYNRGLVSSALKNQQGALSDYNQAIQLNPNNFKAYNNRGMIRWDLKDKQKAIDDFNRAIQLNPTFAETYNNRGVIRFELKEKQGAIDDFNRAIQLNPTFAEAYGNRGYAKFELKDRQGAINDITKAANLFSQHGLMADYEKAMRLIKQLQGE